MDSVLIAMIVSSLYCTVLYSTVQYCSSSIAYLSLYGYYMRKEIYSVSFHNFLLEARRMADSKLTIRRSAGRCCSSEPGVKSRRWRALCALRSGPRRRV